MRLPFTETLFASTFSRACCLLAASALVGCATKNPLMDEPVAAAPANQPVATAKATPPAAPATSTAPAATASAATAAPAPATASAPAAPAATASAPQQSAPAPQGTAPAQTASAATQSGATNTTGATASGVQTSREKRLFGIFSPYRVDIQQGNFISQEQLTQLKTGMTPDQVKFVLGTPLLTDIFHSNRWDYVFRLQKGNGEVISSRIAVIFEDNRLAKVDAGTLPSERDFLSLIAGPVSKAQKAEAPKADAAKTESTTK